MTCHLRTSYSKSNDNDGSKNCDNIENTFDRIYTQVLNQAIEIVTKSSPCGVIRIEIDDAIALGYKDKKEFEDEVISKVVTQVSNITNRDIEYIKCFLKDKFRYNGYKYAR